MSSVQEVASSSGGTWGWKMMRAEEKLTALTNKVKRLEMALAKERRDKRKVVREYQHLQSQLSSVFNKNQLSKLSQPSTRGTKWSAATIKKGLQLKFACGATGYDLLLAQKQPLPSARSLRRSLEWSCRNGAGNFA